MKKMIGLMMLAATFMSGTILIAQDSNAQDSKTIGKYVACDNHAGGGFFWVDTTIGKIWRLEFGKGNMVWKYIGQVKNAKVEGIGTYVPYPNKNGGGLFILNTITGEGWYTSGAAWIKEKEYTVIGKPTDAPEKAE